MRRPGIVAAVVACALAATAAPAGAAILAHQYAGTYSGEGTRQLGKVRFELTAERVVRDFTFSNIDYVCNGLYINVHRYQLRGSTRARVRNGYFRFALRDAGQRQGISYSYTVKGRLNPSPRAGEPVGTGTLRVVNSACPQGRTLPFTYERTTRKYLVP